MAPTDENPLATDRITVLDRAGEHRRIEVNVFIEADDVETPEQVTARLARETTDPTLRKPLEKKLDWDNSPPSDELWARRTSAGLPPEDQYAGMPTRRPYHNGRVRELLDGNVVHWKPEFEMWVLGWGSYPAGEKYADPSPLELVKRENNS